MFEEQNLGLSILFSALGGFANVLATLLLALPNIREKQGRPFSKWLKNALLVGNLFLASLIAGFNILGAIYGPVSIVMPTIQSSILLFNMIIFGAVMGIDQFTRPMIVGTLVMTTAAVLLPVVGPTVQNDQDLEELLMKPLSLFWYGALLFVMVVSGIIVMVINLERTFNALVVILLLFAQVSSKVGKFRIIPPNYQRESPCFSVCFFQFFECCAPLSKLKFSPFMWCPIVSITVAKTFVIATGKSFLISCGVWAISSIILIYTIVKQATVVQQSTYVPLSESS